MKLKDHYEVVAVGGGPAGCMAARSAAEQQVDVLLLERDREIGTPVRCAEAIGRDGVEKIIGTTVSSRAVTTEITRFRFVAPDGSEVIPRVSMTGCVLDRRVFDYQIGELAADAGAHIITGADVRHVGRRDGGRLSLEVALNGTVRGITADIVIGADGVESRVGRWLGVDTTIPMRDMETCSQVTVIDPSIPADQCSFYFSQDRFPGGYAWVFPKGPGIANVGLGISGNLGRGESADRRLQVFLDAHFPAASVVSRSVGGVPCARRLKPIHGDGFLLAGDAAHHSNPLSGGGIATALQAGKLAGRIAAEAVRSGRCDAAFLQLYDEEWERIGGRNHRRYYRIKEAVKKLSDNDLNETARQLRRRPGDDVTLLRVFQVALSRHPALLVDVLGLFLRYG